ncbi:DUF4199 domain-containing protein [Aquimarina sp. MMG015]|uniref:DUF4199 domain-containing protein n=1 Tax=Aquimarina sp. MMG015 TaxID=2822689 RepID=UPI001B39DC80|nr:DUF4199 domain-containing protein [Aquimarina sp. MMG015]MBQ4804113.1 DUF4199 domain-containing protein [Aquimarina sp. MMG015]
MKSKSIPIKKYVLIYGIVLGFSIITYSILTYLTGNYTVKNLFHYSILFLLTISSIITGLILFKKNNEGFISLGEALIIGIGITVFGGIIITLWEILLIRVIDPEIITQLEDKQIKKIAEKANDFTQENIERKIEITKKFTSPLIMFITAFLEDIIVGFTMSLITGLIIRKKRDPFK